MTVSSPSSLPGNILTLADSDFESGTFTWAALTNANTPAVSSSYAFTGLKSLTWTSTASGDSFIATGYYACRQNDGYIFSGYINTVTAAHDTYLGVAWYNSSHTQIGSTLFGAVNPSATGVWQPLTLAATSPAGAAYFKIVLWVSAGVGASETFAADLFYASNPPAQVLIDFANPPFVQGSAAGNDFADVSMWVRWEQNISLNHGRQDAISEIMSGQGSFFLQNDLGWFTPQRSTSPYYPNVSLGCRTQVNVSDPLGNWHTRFDGPISQIAYTVDPVGGTNTANVSLSDVLAFLNRQDPLSCWTKEAVLSDGPWMHWTLDDSGQTGTAAETSGSNGPNLRLVANQSGSQVASATWQNENGGVETLADAAAPGQPDGSQFWIAGHVQPNSQTRGLVSGAVGPVQSPLSTINFVPSLTVQSATNMYIGTDGYQLNGELILGGIPQPVAPDATGSDYTLECWFIPDPTIKADAVASKNLGPFIPVSLGSGRHGACLVAGLFYGASQTIKFEVATYTQPPAFAMAAYNVNPSPAASFSTSYTPDSVGRPHHLVLTFQGASGGATLTAYLDNSYQGTLTLPVGIAYDTICVGGAYGGHGNWYGNIACVSIYQYALSLSQIADHCQAGQYGHWESSTDNCVYWLGQYAGIPEYWNNLANQYTGLSLTEYLNISGQTALSSMQYYEKAEQGLLYVSTAGQLTFHTRDWRMGYGAPDLALPADVYTADLGYELIDTGLLNEAATATVTYTAGVDWTSSASQNAYGVYANGTAQSPVQVPLITWSRAYSQLGLQNTTGTSFQNNPSGFGVTTSAYGFYPDPNLNDNASWQVNTRNTPALVCGQLTVDLLTLDPTSGVTVAQVYGLDIDNVITLTGLPSSFPDQAGALDYFIEGINETIGQQQWQLKFYTSPASVQRAWKPGDATYGQLGVTSRIGVSAPDVSIPAALGKSVSHDAGAPYWPPSFTTTPAAVQISWADVNPGTSITLTPNVSTGNGDMILIQVLAAAAATVTATDTAGNSYAQIGLVTFASTRKQYVLASFGSLPLKTSDSITITGSVSQEYTTSAYDITNIMAVDGSAVTAAATSASPSISLGTLTGANDFELVIVANVGSKILNIPAGWTQVGGNIQGAYENQLFWKQAASTSGDTLSSTYPAGSTAWGAIGIAFTLSPLVMNNPANNGHGFIGANDIRGLTSTLQTALTPPLLVVGTANHTSSYTTGNNGVQNHAVWDTVFVDTAGGMGVVPAWPNWYCVLVPGFYEISATFNWQLLNSGSAGIRTAWIVVAQAGAQQVAAGTGTPYADSYVCPIGEQVYGNSNNVSTTNNPVTRLYLGVGDMVGLGVMHTQGSTQNSFTQAGGPMMSIRWIGHNTSQDQIPLALTPGTGTATAAQSRLIYSQTFFATGSYSYYGTHSSQSPQLRITNGSMYQGQQSGWTASQFSFATFPSASIISALTGASVIKSVQLTMTNNGSHYSTGSELMVGWTTSAGFGSTFTPSGGTQFDTVRVKFKEGQTVTADITGAGIGTAFWTGGATALAFGNNKTTALGYFGTWVGNTVPALTITWAK